MRFTILAYRVGVPPLWHISGRDASFVDLRHRSSSDAFRQSFTLHPTAHAVAAVAKKSQNLPAPEVGTVASGSIRAQVRGVTLRSVMRMVAPRSYQDLGFDTAASGAVSMQWTGNAEDSRVTANVALSAGSGREGVPLSGLVDATYDNRRGVVDIRRVTAKTPGSQADVQGSLGVYPLQRPSAIHADLVTTNLGEFDKTLTALGVSANDANGKETGLKAIPVQLQGQAEFSGTVTGSLLRPDVKGHLTATNFDTIFATADEAPPSAGNATGVAADVSTPPSPVVAQQASVQPGMNGKLAAITDIHWDSIDAMAEYSPDLISVQQATLSRGKTAIRFSGQLHAHQRTRRQSEFDNGSAIQAMVDVQKESIGDLAALLGSTVPVTGGLTLQAHVGGTLSNLNGGGHLAVTGGQIYGQPYRSLSSDLRFTGQELDATNVKFLEDGGQILGDGGYDIHAKTFHFQAKGTGFELDHFPQLKTAKLSLAGALEFQATGSGTISAPTAHATVSVSRLVVNDQYKGSLGAQIDLDHESLNYRVNSNLDLAKLELIGQTTLTGDYPTEAKLAAESLHIGRLLQLYNVKGVIERVGNYSAGGGAWSGEETEADGRHAACQSIRSFGRRCRTAE